LHYQIPEFCTKWREYLDKIIETTLNNLSIRKQLITLMLGSTELEIEALIVKNTNNY
jgi:hypothetical protein